MEKQTVRILIVDDNAHNRKSLRALLDSPDYQILEAESGNKALSLLLQEEHIALILLDVQMPTMDGFELASLIKQRDKTRDIPIIFISAYHIEEADIFKGYQLGAFDYLTKPYLPEVLKSKVAMFVSLFLKNEAIKRQYYLELNANPPYPGKDVENRVSEGTLEQLFPEYRRLIIGYVQAVRLQNTLPLEQIRLFAEKMGAIQFSSRDLIRLHLKVLKKLEQQILPSEAQAFSLDARLFLVELMAQLADHYRRRNT